MLIFWYNGVGQLTLEDGFKDVPYTLESSTARRFAAYSEFQSHDYLTCFHCFPLLPFARCFSIYQFKFSNAQNEFKILSLSKCVFETHSCSIEVLCIMKQYSLTVLYLFLRNIIFSSPNVRERVKTAILSCS